LTLVFTGSADSVRFLLEVLEMQETNDFIGFLFSFTGLFPCIPALASLDFQPDLRAKVTERRRVVGSIAPTRLYSFNWDGANFTDIGAVKIGTSHIDADALAYSPNSPQGQSRWTSWQI
jgi:hypothetical protein